MAFEYKVDSVRAEINDRSVQDGTAGGKVAAQIEIKLKEWASKGFEYYRSDVVEVEVKGTCLFGLMPDPKSNFHITILVFFFRREIK